MTSPVLWVRALFSARMVAVLMVLAVAGSLLYRAVNQEWVLYRQAETAFASGRNADALRLVRTLRDKAPGQKKFHVRVAELALRAGDAELAEQWMNPVLSKGEKLTLSEVRLAAGIADAQRKSGAALGYYEGFVRGGGQLDIPSRLHLADLHREMKAYDKADSIYRELIKHPGDFAWKARLHLAEMLSWQQGYAEALALFRQVLAAHPESRDARLGLARTLDWMGAHEEAVAEYRKLTGDG